MFSVSSKSNQIVNLRKVGFRVWVLLLGMFLLASLTGCSARSEAPTTGVVPLDTEFTLYAGESAYVQELQLTITVRSVGVVWNQAGTEMPIVELNIDSPYKRAPFQGEKGKISEIGDYQLTIVDVSPYGDGSTRLIVKSP
jgi:hypothetical protein